MDALELTQEKAIITTDGAQWLEGLQDLSALSPVIALNTPLARLVEATIAAACSDSENTARAYQTHVGIFLQWLSSQLYDRLPDDWRPLARPTKEGRKTVWEYRGLAAILRAVTAGTLDSFRTWRAAEGDSKQTQALRLGAVSTFLRVAYRDGVLTHEQAQNMGLKPYKKRDRKDEKPVGRRLKPDEVRALRFAIETARNDRKANRDRAILDLMLYAGLRRDEVTNLAADNFKQDGGRWWIVLKGKGQKTRRVKVHDALYRSLAEWAVLAGLTLGNGQEPLFCNLTKGGNPTGKALNTSVIGRIVAEYGNRAGLAPLTGENCLSAHDLRRTCARNAYENGATLAQIQTTLGHADVKTTMRYIGSLEDDSNTAIDFVRY